MKTILIIITFLFSISVADASAISNKRPRRNGVTKKVTWNGEKNYKKTRYKPVVITSKMFAGENIRKFGASSKF